MIQLSIPPHVLAALTRFAGLFSVATLAAAGPDIGAPLFFVNLSGLLAAAIYWNADVPQRRKW